jgi:hypothetical protein
LFYVNRELVAVLKGKKGMIPPSRFYIFLFLACSFSINNSSKQEDTDRVKGKNNIFKGECLAKL